MSADFNGDGVVDLAVTNTANNTVSILLGKGDGTFAAAATVTVGAGPTELVTADFNGDGKADIATATASATVTILLGNGDGTFKRIDVAAGGNPVSLAPGDFNGDGKMDLAAAVGSNVQILLGNGDGTFSLGSSFTPAATPLQVRAADLNADGKLDLAIGSCCQGTDVTYGDFYVYGGNGDGTFTLKFSSNQADGTKLTVADVTGDGLPDLIMPYHGCHTPCQGVEVVVNNGNFNFTRFGGSGFDIENYGPPGPAIVGDFNGDGHLEVAASIPPGEGNWGQDGYDKMLIWTLGAGATFSTQRDYAIGTKTGPWGATSADFNHDGKTDFAVIESQTGKVAVFLNNTGAANAQLTFDMTLMLSPETVAAGGTAQYEYYFQATNGVLPQLQLSCSGLPAGAACSFGTAPSGTTSLGFFGITTTAPASAAVRHSFAWLALAFPFGFVMLPVRRRRLVWIGLIVLGVMVFIQVGCGGGAKNLATTTSPSTSTSTSSSTGGTNSSGTTSGSSGSSSGGTSGSGTTGTPVPTPAPTPTPAPASSATPAGTYQVTVTATGGGITQSKTITLIVQ